MKYYLINEQDIYELSVAIEDLVLSFLENKEVKDDQEETEEGPSATLEDQTDFDF